MITIKHQNSLSLVNQPPAVVTGLSSTFAVQSRILFWLDFLHPLTGFEPAVVIGLH